MRLLLQATVNVFVREIIAVYCEERVKLTKKLDSKVEVV